MDAKDIRLLLFLGALAPLIPHLRMNKSKEDFMKTHSTTTVKVHLPRIPKQIATYLDWAEEQNLTISEVLNETIIKDHFKNIKTSNENKLAIIEQIKQNNNTVARAYLDGYLIEHQNYFEIVPEENWAGDIDRFVPEHINYIGKEPKAYDSFEVLQKLYHIEHQEHISMTEVLQNTIDRVSEREEIYQEFIELYPDYREELTDFEAVAKELSAELFELVIPDNIQRMFEQNGFRMGTVGQSNWSHYVTHKSHDNHSEAIDIWEGWNFYTIRLLETNNDNLFLGYAEELHFAYAPDMDDILNIIESYFGLKRSEIAIILTETTENLTDVAKLSVREELFIEEITD